MKKVVLVLVGGLMMMSCQSKVEKIQGKIDAVNAKIELKEISLDSIQELKNNLVKVYVDSIDVLMAQNDSLFDYAFNRDEVRYGSYAYRKAHNELDVNHNIIDKLFTTQEEIMDGEEYKAYTNEQDSILKLIEPFEAELTILNTALLQAKIDEAGK